MEAAGLVLGALPLVIQAFQTYRTILATMKNTQHELNSMIRDLKTETLILQNTCETLLRGIASDSEIEDMIENPYGDAWKGYDDEVRLRMWRSGQVFQDRVADMMKATSELQERLALDGEGKARLTDRASILIELRCKTSFTLRKDQYVSILARLHDGNAVLSELARQNSDLESTRRSRSQTKAARLIRRLSASIFSALQGSMRCSLLGTQGKSSQRWDNMRVRLAEKEVSPQVLTIPPAQPQPPKRKLRWASSLSVRPTKIDPSSSSSKAPLNSSTTPVTHAALPRAHITDLCQILRKGKCLSSQCYGFINGKSNQFDLYHQDGPLSCCSTITLRQILEGKDKNINNLGYPERLKLALTLSFSVLHLYNTPWLSKIVTLDDIVFFRGEDTLGYSDSSDDEQTYRFHAPVTWIGRSFKMAALTIQEPFGGA
ncbi:uncharacterized protein J7T55_010875 [Diaporthe amygdali]|uniref:uncharacterized protein n=1 Tax=Phomopsis amygdali TaxID=1214568 RepID=UPI0022FE9D05|nr:uncharacterized protein J7T55_010875 [Diaporthe amygdali]KAJ0104411.1 uncharacterized protein J7T55_010875 [Diaporthe amygdali]